MGRTGQALLWVGGLGVAAVMAYTLWLDVARSHDLGHAGTPHGVTDVAVFYPERLLWQEFRQGVAVCERKGLVRVEAEAETSVLVKTPRHGRLLRFAWHDVPGLRATREEAERLALEAPAPVAFVGSSNTVLTASIAEALRDADGGQGRDGPVLLIPWASSVLAERPEPGAGPVALLDIAAGRSFRFCLNDQYQADLVVGCLTQNDDGRRPKKVVVVEDRFDPYSVDLASCFHRAIERFAPSAEITERADLLSTPILHDPSDLPTASEEALAESIWRDAAALPPGQTMWVVLPLQELPTRRMIGALRRHLRPGPKPGESPVRVVCGDAIGWETLAKLAGHCPFPLWCVSATSSGVVGRGMSPDVQIEAEIVSAVARALDTPGDGPADPSAIRAALAGLKIPADDSAAMGRPLAFTKSGERAGDDLGRVLTIRPDRDTVFSLSRERAGRWRGPVELTSELAARP